MAVITTSKTTATYDVIIVGSGAGGGQGDYLVDQLRKGNL